jgi:hypothetical protein
MQIRLGPLALEADPTAARKNEPMLADQAWQVYHAAPIGSPVELRAALVLVCLASRELVAPALAIARAVGYDVGALGGQLYGVVKVAGGVPSNALQALKTLHPAQRTPEAPPVDRHSDNDPGAFGPRPKRTTEEGAPPEVP